MNQPSNNWKVKLALLLVSSLTIMSVITISPALPEMATAYSEVSNVGLLVQLVLTIPALMIAVVAPFSDRLIDRHGRLPVLFFALLLYAICGVSGYWLEDLWHILISRAVLGMAVGMSMTTVITLIADYFQGSDRQKFAGAQIAFMSLSGILFMGLAGVLADLGWRYPFLIYLFALPVLACAMAFLYEPAVSTGSRKEALNITAPRLTWMLYINMMLMWIVFFLIPVQIPFYLKSIGIEESSLIGAAVAISTGSSAVSSFLYSRMKDRLSFLSVFFLGYLLMAAGFICISMSDTFALASVAMILTGLGMGMMIPNTNTWVMKIVPPEIRGREIGKLTTFWFFGQFISPIVMLPLSQVRSASGMFSVAAQVLLFLSLVSLVLHYSKFGKLVIGQDRPVAP